MKNNDFIAEYEPEARESRVYRTGSTCPPKSFRGILAVLLVLVIFLGGIVSALSLANIRLLHIIQEQNAQVFSSVSFSFEQPEKDSFSPIEPTLSQSPDAVSDTAFSGGPVLGVVCQTVSSYDQFFYRIPQGVYILEVVENGTADRHGLAPGDILLLFNDTRITNTDALKSFLYACRPGDTVSAVIFRSGKKLAMTLTLGNN